MENKENIGTLIKSQLENLKKSPDDALWDKINSSLDKRDRRRKRFFFLFFVSFLIILTLFIINAPKNLFTNSNQTPNQIVLSPKQDNKFINKKSGEVNSNKEIYSANKINTNNIFPLPEDDLFKAAVQKKYTNDTRFFDFRQYATGTLKDENYKENNHLTQAIVSNKKSTTVNKSVLNSQSPSVPIISGKNEKKNTNSESASIKEETEQNDFGNENEETNTEEEASITLNDSLQKPKKKEPIENTQEDNSKKWSVSVTGGYVIYTPFNKNSLIDSNLNNNEREGSFTFSYGAALNFQFLENLRFSVGVNKNILSYTTSNVPSSNETERNRILNYSALNANPEINESQFTDFINNDVEINLIHEIKYLEVPLHLTYKLINGKFGFHLIGGVSMNFVSGNEVFVQNSNNDQLKLGSVKTLINGNVSLNFGTGVYYNISEKLSFEVNPSFRYSLSKYNNRNDSDKPNLMGVYTVLTYKIF